MTPKHVLLLAENNKLSGCDSKHFESAYEKL
jgi:hypothetical protein